MGLEGGLNGKFSLVCGLWRVADIGGRAMITFRQKQPGADRENESF
jgi:hypothetical protein